MITTIATTKCENGYCEKLFKTKKRFYRIVRSETGNMYNIYTNDSEYGEPEYDRPMCFDNRRVREYTIGECKESIKIYDMVN